jgi:hypothetical protein
VVAPTSAGDRPWAGDRRGRAHPAHRRPAGGNAAGLPGYRVTGPSLSLALVILLAVAMLAVVGEIRWWWLGGFASPSQWRALPL